MDALTDLFMLSDAYGAATGLAEATVSDRVLKGGGRLSALRAGRGDIGVHRLRTAILWFSDNWPDNTPWPAEIRRPPRDEEAADPPSDPSRTCPAPTAVQGNPGDAP